MESYTPNKLAAVAMTDFVFPDMEKEIEKYSEDKKRKIIVKPVKVGKKPVRLILNGTLTGSAVSVSNFDDSNEAHSVGFAFEDAEDLKALEFLNQSLFDAIPGFDEEEEFKINEIVKDDKIYLKFKFDKQKSRYIFKSNVKLSPKSPSSADLNRHDQVTVSVEFSLYFNLADKICGLLFTITKFDVVKEEAVESQESLVDVEAAEVPVNKKGSKRQKKE